MKRILFYGNFGSENEIVSDGQTSKTINFFKYTSMLFSDCIFDRFNTKNFKRNIIKNIILLRKKIREADIIVIFPGSVKSLNIFRIIYHNCNKKIFYPVVGGWIADKITTNKKLIKFLKGFVRIYPETYGLQKKLESLGIYNTLISPTFSLRETIPFDALIKQYNSLKKDKEIKLVYFGRITETKGIYLAIDCINKLNSSNDLDVVFKLDFYGKLASNENFEYFYKNLNENIQYKGLMRDDDVWLLCQYDYFLFPTFYPGEGIPACCVESLLYATPVIASDWKYNSEIIKDGENGYIFNLKQNSLFQILYKIIKTENILDAKYRAFLSGQNYLPEIAIKPYIDDLKEIIYE